jgi:hypothetical protein
MVFIELLLFIGLARVLRRKEHQATRWRRLNRTSTTAVNNSPFRCGVTILEAFADQVFASARSPKIRFTSQTPRLGAR